MVVHCLSVLLYSVLMLKDKICVYSHLYYVNIVILPIIKSEPPIVQLVLLPTGIVTFFFCFFFLNCHQSNSTFDINV